MERLVGACGHFGYLDPSTTEAEVTPSWWETVIPKKRTLLKMKVCVRGRVLPPHSWLFRQDLHRY